MNFMFGWPKQYLTSERSLLVRHWFGHENIKSISLSQRVMLYNAEEINYSNKSLADQSVMGIKFEIWFLLSIFMIIAR